MFCTEKVRIKTLLIYPTRVTSKEIGLIDLPDAGHVQRDSPINVLDAGYVQKITLLIYSTRATSKRDRDARFASRSI